MGVATHPDLAIGVPTRQPVQGSLPVSNPPTHLSHIPEQHLLGPEPKACHTPFKETLNPLLQKNCPKQEEQRDDIPPPPGKGPVLPSDSQPPSPHTGGAGTARPLALVHAFILQGQVSKLSFGCPLLSWVNVGQSPNGRSLMGLMF